MAAAERYAWRPDWAVHPGELLKDELVEREMTQTALAEATGFTQKHISMVVTGKAGIGIELALALERLWGTRGEVWMRLQADFDCHQVRHGLRPLASREEVVS